MSPSPTEPSDVDRGLDATVRVFGGTGVHTLAGPVSIGGPRQRRLLALLAVRAGSVVSLDWLTEYLWDDADRPAGPERAIRTYVSRLRGSLPEALGGWIETEGDGYRLAAPPDAIEHQRFSMLRAEARRARDRDDPAAARAALDEALSMWRGEPFVELERPRLGAGRNGATPARSAGDARGAMGNRTRARAAHPDHR